MGLALARVGPDVDAVNGGEVDNSNTEQDHH
jgi:hypothetical protein